MKTPPMKVTGELCRACVNAGCGKMASMMDWYENGLQGIIPVKLFQSKEGMWRSGTGLKTTSRCSCMRIWVESVQDQYQKSCNRH